MQICKSRILILFTDSLQFTYFHGKGNMSSRTIYSESYELFMVLLTALVFCDAQYIT
jgi:hypothetical protein